MNQLLKEKLNETAEVDATILIPDGSMRVRILAYYHKTKVGGGYCQKITSQPIMPEYCPFCGKKYKEDET